MRYHQIRFYGMKLVNEWVILSIQSSTLRFLFLTSRLHDLQCIVPFFVCLPFFVIFNWETSIFSVYLRSSIRPS